MSSIKTKLECPKCKNLFSSRGGNYDKHIKVCDGVYIPFVKLQNCKYCNLLFDITFSTSLRANHTRWCDLNPNRNEYVKNSNDGKQLRTPNAICNRIAAIKKAHADGKYKSLDYSWNKGRKHSEETKELLRQKALSSSHRRLRRKMIEYNGVWLDSTWELELAKRLDSMKIKWVRPDPIPWVDSEGVTHNYFPDFYLTDYDIFLDPKNPQAKKVQKKKIDMIMSQYKNVVILNSVEECQSYMPSLL